MYNIWLFCDMVLTTDGQKILFLDTSYIKVKYWMNMKNWSWKKDFPCSCIIFYCTYPATLPIVLRLLEYRWTHWKYFFLITALNSFYLFNLLFMWIIFSKDSCGIKPILATDHKFNEVHMLFIFIKLFHAIADPT